MLAIDRVETVEMQSELMYVMSHVMAGIAARSTPNIWKALILVPQQISVHETSYLRSDIPRRA